MIVMEHETLRSPVEPPVSISKEARAALVAPWPVMPPYPDPGNHAAWRDFVFEQNEIYFRMFSENASHFPPATRSEIAGVPVVRVPHGPSQGQASRKVYLDMHGGGLVFFGGKYLTPMAQMTAMWVQMDVVSIDYRMPPDDPYPAGLDDCLAVYEALVEQVGAQNIVVGGTSAGGNLAVALMLRANAQCIALPAGLVLLSPEVDLTESGDSFRVMLGVDRLRPLMPANLLYAAGAPLDHPFVSPLFGDFSGGFPRTFIQSGTRDLFLSNAVRLHRALRRAEVEAELHVWEALPHGRFFGTPEDLEMDEAIRTFIRSC